MTGNEHDAQIEDALRGPMVEWLEDNGGSQLTADRLLSLLLKSPDGKLRYGEMLAQCVKRGWLSDESGESRAALSAALKAVPTVKSWGGWVVLRPWRTGMQQTPGRAPLAVVDIGKLAQALRLTVEAFGFCAVGDERLEG